MTDPLRINAVTQLSDHQLALLAAQGFARLLRDINAPETRLDLAALRLEHAAIPGHTKPAHWFDSNTNGFSDEAQT